MGEAPFAGGGGGKERAASLRAEQRLAPGGRAALPLTRTRPIARISLTWSQEQANTGELTALQDGFISS